MSDSRKTLLRAALAAARAGLDPDVRRAADATIAATVRALLHGTGGCVAAYAALATEVQTAELLEAVCAEWGWVALPVYAPDGAAALARCEDPGTLVVGAHGVRVPPPPWTLVEPHALDAIVVPGVGFDRTGARLGRGGGFYDRLLARVRGRRIGVAYGCQIVERVPREPHDAGVDTVVTERGVYDAAAEARPTDR